MGGVERGVGEEADGFCHGGLEEAAVGGVLEAVGWEGLAEGEEGGEDPCEMVVSRGWFWCGERGRRGTAHLFLKTISWLPSDQR